MNRKVLPKQDELDEYEQELYHSMDPADHTALLIRLALRQAKVDPDSDEWYIRGVQMKSDDPNLVVEDVKLRYRPTIQRVVTLDVRPESIPVGGGFSGRLEVLDAQWGPNVRHVDKNPRQEPEDDGFRSVDTYRVPGRGVVKVVQADKRLLDTVIGKDQRPITIDGEEWIITGVEWRGRMEVGNFVCFTLKRAYDPKELADDQFLCGTCARPVLGAEMHWRGTARLCPECTSSYDQVERDKVRR